MKEARASFILPEAVEIAQRRDKFSPRLSREHSSYLSFYVYLSNAVLLKFSTFRGQEEIANANSLPICLVSHTKTRCKYSKYFANMLSFIEKTTKKYAKKWLKANRELHISLMHCDSQCTFFDEGLYTSNDSLRIEVTIKPLIEACLEVEEEQHHFTGL